jgi:hypothetical protein
VAIVAGVITALGRRAALVVLVLGAAFALQAERPANDDFWNRAYRDGVTDEHHGIAVEQARGDRFEEVSAVTVDAPCQIVEVALDVRPRPPQLTVLSATGATTATLSTDSPTFARYAVATPTAGVLTIPLPARSIITVGDDPSDVVASRPSVGAPLFRGYCDTTNAEDKRFEQLFAPLHVNIPRPVVLDWDDGWFIAALCALAVVAVRALRREPPSRARPAPRRDRDRPTQPATPAAPSGSTSDATAGTAV